MDEGGIIDKPGKGRDYYHTCYGLSGLSVSQYFGQSVVNICDSDDSLLVNKYFFFRFILKNKILFYLFFVDLEYNTSTF